MRHALRTPSARQVLSVLNKRPEWQQKHVKALREHRWSLQRIKAVTDYLNKPLSNNQKNLLMDITFYLEEMLKKKDWMESRSTREEHYIQLMGRALGAGLRHHPLVHEFITLQQAFGKPFTAREPVGNSHRKLKRDAARSLDTEERQLHAEITKLIATARYKSWPEVRSHLRANKNEQPWESLLTGNSRQSFDKLRHRLGFFGPIPRILDSRTYL